MARQTVDKKFFITTISHHLSTLQAENVANFKDALANVLSLDAGKNPNPPLKLSAQTAQALGFGNRANTTWELKSEDLEDLKYEALSVYAQSHLLLSCSPDQREAFLRNVSQVLPSSSTTVSWLQDTMWGVSNATDLAHFLKTEFFSANESITQNNLEKIVLNKELVFFKDMKRGYLYQASKLLIKQESNDELKKFFTSTEDECYKKAEAFIVKKAFDKDSSKQNFSEDEKGYLKIFLVLAAYRVVRETLLSSVPNEEQKMALKNFSEGKLEEGNDTAKTRPALQKLSELLTNSGIKLAATFLTKNQVEELQKEIKAHLATLNQPNEDFLSRSKEVLTKDEAIKLQKEIAEFINKAVESDLKANQENIYSKALTAYVISGVLTSADTDEGKKNRKERLLKLFANPLNIDFEFVKKASCEMPCLINDNKFASIPDTAISQAVKTTLTAGVLLIHIAAETQVVQLKEWLEAIGKNPQSADFKDKLKERLEAHIKTFFFGQQAPHQAEFTTVAQVINPENAQTQALFTKAAVFKLLDDRIYSETDVTKLQELFRKNPVEIKETGDVDVVRGKHQFIKQDQLQEVWKDQALKNKLKKALEARAAQLAKKPDQAPEFATTVRFQTLMADFKTVVQKILPGAKVDADNENIATVKEGDVKTTIERIPPAGDGSGGAVKVTGSVDAVVKALAKLYVEELLASQKISRDPMGKISAQNGFTFQLSSKIISLNKKEGGEIDSDERRTFLEALDKELNAQLPHIYVAGSISKEPAADSNDSKKPDGTMIRSRLAAPSIFTPPRKNPNDDPSTLTPPSP